MNRSISRSSGDQTVQARVYSQLRQSILDGDFRPGRSVTIRGLADELNVSPMPVREALRRLTTERALEVSGTGRVSVPKMTPAKLQELVRARICLEKQAAIDAMPFIGKTRLQRLTRFDRKINRMIARADHQGYVIAHRKFHFDLYSAGKGSVFMPLIESVWLQISPFLTSTLLHLDSYSTSDRHIEILAALENQDATALGFAVEADIRHGLGALTESDWQKKA
ncbi:MAG: GntR family transcriptional regulator [Pseudomonadota bacterium]